MTVMTRRNFGLAAGMATAVALTAGALISLSAEAAPNLQAGTAAPSFTDAMTATGDTISLSDFEGKTVVMEWTNHDCPFVVKHYSEPVKNMQTLQADATADDVVWIQVISSAEGKQGYLEGPAAIAKNEERGAASTYTILDPEGTIGRAYGAKTTPHMYVITGKGNLAYSGAIDSIKSARVSDIAKAENYVTAALSAVAAGTMPTVDYATPYGCSVKY